MVVLEGDNLDFGEDFELNVRAWNNVDQTLRRGHDESIMTDRRTDRQALILVITP
jgi:hypothetical protein